MNVFVAHFTSECNEHVSQDAELGDFLLQYGDDCTEAMGIRDIFEEAGIGIIPSLFAGLHPSGMISRAAFDAIADRMLSDLKGHLDEIDALYLQFHGASGIRGLEGVSGEHYLVKRMREIVGDYMPIAMVMDPHGNVTSELVGRLNIVRCYRESPHIDTVESERIVARKLVDLMRRRRPMRPVMLKLPIMVGGERSVSAMEPMRSINALLDEAEKDPRVFSSSYHVGYIRHDDDKLGAAVVVVPNNPEDRPHCEEVAGRVAAYAWEHRHEFTFTGNFGEPDESVRDAVAFEGKTAVITDSGDNCGAGGAGRGTVMLRELLRQDLRGKSVLIAGINDPAACAYLGTCADGEHVSFDLGVGEDDLSTPVRVEGVLKVSGDALVGLGQIHRVGPSHIVSINGTTIDVLVMDKNVQYGTMEQFHGAGVDFHDYDIVVVKMGYLDTYLIPETAYHTMALTDGPTIQRSEHIPFKRIFRPMWPIDEMDELVCFDRC